MKKSSKSGDKVSYYLVQDPETLIISVNKRVNFEKDRPLLKDGKLYYYQTSTVCPLFKSSSLLPRRLLRQLKEIVFERLIKFNTVSLMNTQDQLNSFLKEHLILSHELGLDVSKLITLEIEVVDNTVRYTKSVILNPIKLIVLDKS